MARKRRARSARGAGRRRDRNRASSVDAPRRRRRQRRRRRRRSRCAWAAARGWQHRTRAVWSRWWRWRTRGALTRRAARAGAELAKERAASTRQDGAGGNGGVGAEGRRALGRRRGDGQRSVRRVMSQGRRGHARGVLVRRAPRAGAELATGRAAPTRHDGAGGNGDVGAEGRRAFGMRRSVERRARGVMSRVWRWRARGALVRRAARAGADLAKGEWVGAGERPRARRRRGRRRSHDPTTRLWA